MVGWCGVKALREFGGEDERETVGEQVVSPVRVRFESAEHGSNRTRGNYSFFGRGNFSDIQRNGNGNDGTVDELDNVKEEIGSEATTQVLEQLQVTLVQLNFIVVGEIIIIGFFGRGLWWENGFGDDGLGELSLHD